MIEKLLFFFFLLIWVNKSVHMHCQLISFVQWQSTLLFLLEVGPDNPSATAYCFADLRTHSSAADEPESGKVHFLSGFTSRPVLGSLWLYNSFGNLNLILSPFSLKGWHPLNNVSCFEPKVVQPLRLIIEGSVTFSRLLSTANKGLGV